MGCRLRGSSVRRTFVGLSGKLGRGAVCVCLLAVLGSTALLAKEPVRLAAGTEVVPTQPKIIWVVDHSHDHDDARSRDHSHSHEPVAVAPEQEKVVWGLTIVYGLIVATASLIGGTLPQWMTLTHTRMQSMLSFVGGLMLGIALLHMLPHALHDVAGNAIDRVAMCVLLGVVTMFIMLRAFHFHVHEPPGVVEADHSHAHDHDHAGPLADGHDCGHGHCEGVRGKSMSWVGMFVGLAVHTLLDGVALGAAIRIDAAHASGWGLFGLGTLGAIALHKPLDSLSITSLMTAEGWSFGWRLLVNATYALLCLTGASLFHLGVQPLGGSLGNIVPYTLAFSAGMFLSISLGDLLPEMQFHSHNRVKLTVMLLLGIVAAWGIGYLEPSHLHSHG